MRHHNAELIERLAESLHADSDDPAQWNSAGLHVRCEYRDRASELLDREHALTWAECAKTQEEYYIEVWDYEHGFRDDCPKPPTNPYYRT